MSTSCGGRRRAFPPVGGEPLEGRVAMSGVGPAHPIASSAHIASLAGPSDRAGQAGEDRPRSTAVAACHPSGSSARVAAAPTARRWYWLAGTYWCVPTPNLPAVLFDSTTQTLAPVSDQTVFQVTGYREGYFWGKSVTQLGSSPASGSSMVGSVTPQGRVVLTFTSTGGSSPSVTEGFGQMQRKHGQWTMENQMFTWPDQTLQLGHWAYMVQTHPGLTSWDSLPGAGVSVPTFLGEAGGSGPEPVGP